MNTIIAQENQQLRPLYHQFCNISPGIQSWAYEMNAHVGLRLPNSVYAIPPLVPMCAISGSPDTPHFKVHITGSSLQLNIPRANTRTPLFFEASSLPDLDDKTYYVPSVPNFPLFDSFLIDFSLSRRERIVTIWVFQMTVAPRHGGSAQGFPIIRKLIAALQGRLKAEASSRKSKPSTVPTIRVRYVLVGPDSPSSARGWNMPKGWNETITLHDHRGDVFYQHIPVPVRLS